MLMNFMSVISHVEDVPVKEQVEEILTFVQKYNQMFDAECHSALEELETAMGPLIDKYQSDPTFKSIMDEVSEYKNWSSQVEEIIPTEISIDPYTNKKCAYDQLQLWDQ